MKILKFLLDRLKERSTWMGIIGLVTAAGISLSPEETAAIASAGVALVGAISVFTKG